VKEKFDFWFESNYPIVDFSPLGRRLRSRLKEICFEAFKLGVQKASSSNIEDIEIFLEFKLLIRKDHKDEHISIE
jgi:hypothetical protein